MSSDPKVKEYFKGPIACTRIKFGRGVCGTSWKEQKTILVPDVDKFPGHIGKCNFELYYNFLNLFYPSV